MRRRAIVLALLLSCCFVSSSKARLGVVVTRDGNSFDGDVADDATTGTVTILIHGVPYKVKRANVDTIVYTDEVDADVRTKLAALSPKDVDGRLKLARYALDHHALAASRDVLLDVVRIDPANAEAHAQLDRVRSLIKSQEPLSPTTVATQPVATPAAVPTTAATSAPAKLEDGVIRAVTADEINTIRQTELREGDSVRVKVDGDLRRQFAEYISMPIGEFSHLTPLQQALLILSKGKRNMRQGVKILNDPTALSVYRKDVNKLVVAGCATSKCHGGSTPGKFRLFPQGDNEASAYSNFIILQKYRQTIRNQQRLMLDRQNPENSLLLDYLLPPELSDFPHPEKKAYRGTVRNRTDSRLLQVLKWIRDDLDPVAPNYGSIDLTRPALTDSASSAPEQGDSTKPSEDSRTRSH